MITKDPPALPRGSRGGRGALLATDRKALLAPVRNALLAWRAWWRAGLTEVTENVTNSLNYYTNKHVASRKS